MNRTKYPPGWDEIRVRKVLDYYESQSDEEAAAEIEATCESTTVEVPTALLPLVRQLIARRKASRTRKTHINKRILAARGVKRTKSGKPSRRGKIRG